MDNSDLEKLQADLQKACKEHTFSFTNPDDFSTYKETLESEYMKWITKHAVENDINPDGLKVTASLKVIASDCEDVPYKLGIHIEGPKELMELLNGLNTEEG